MKILRYLLTLTGMCVLLSEATPQTPDAFPPDSVTSRMDYENMLQQLGIRLPDLPSVDDDPSRPAHIHPANPGERGAWLWWSDADYRPGDTLRYQVTRSPFGLWMNYDESPSREGAYPPVDPLADAAGGPVLTPDDWWQRARPQWQALCEESVWGLRPAAADSLHIEWTQTDAGPVEGFPGYRAYVVEGRIDTSRHPSLRHQPVIHARLYVPDDAQGVPLIIQLAWMKEGVPTAYLEPCAARGWAFLQMDPTRLQPDDGAHLTDYLIGLCNGERWRRPSDWGTLSAWGWGASRLADFFEGDPRIDSRRVGLAGHSRYGKSALAAMALDGRFSLAYLSCSGMAGTSPMRRHYGEDFESLGWDRLHHWLAGAAMRWCGPLVPGRQLPRRVLALPVDAQVMVALCAPRPLFIATGHADTWSDPVGSYLTCLRVSPVYRLLGTAGFQDCGERLPAVDKLYDGGPLAYRMHRGDHTDVIDWPLFVEWAAKWWEQRTETVTVRRKTSACPAPRRHEGRGRQSGLQD